MQPQRAQNAVLNHFKKCLYGFVGREKQQISTAKQLAIKEILRFSFKNPKMNQKVSKFQISTVSYPRR